MEDRPKKLHYAKPGYGPSINPRTLISVFACFVLLFLLGIPILIFLERDSHTTARVVTCMTNMKVIWTAASMYAKKHEGQFPPDLATLVKDDPEVFDNARFVCPSSSTETPAKASPSSTWDQMFISNTNTPPDTHCSYIWLGAGKTLNDPPNTPILYEWNTFHNGGFNVVCLDGSYETLPANQTKIKLPFKLGALQPTSHTGGPTTERADR